MAGCRPSMPRYLAKPTWPDLDGAERVAGATAKGLTALGFEPMTGLRRGAGRCGAHVTQYATHTAVHT